MLGFFKTKKQHDRENTAPNESVLIICSSNKHCDVYKLADKYLNLNYLLEEIIASLLRGEHTVCTALTLEDALKQIVGLRTKNKITSACCLKANLNASTLEKRIQAAIDGINQLKKTGEKLGSYTFQKYTTTLDFREHLSELLAPQQTCPLTR